MMLFSEMIARWPDIGDFAEDLGITRGHARTIRERRAVPPALWDKMAEGAERRGLKGITLAAMQAAYQKRYGRPERAAA